MLHYTLPIYLKHLLDDATEVDIPEVPASVLASGRPSEVGSVRLEVDAPAVAVETVGRPSGGKTACSQATCSGENGGGDAIGVGIRKIVRTCISNKKILAQLSNFAAIQFLSTWFPGCAPYQLLAPPSLRLLLRNTPPLSTPTLPSPEG